jgi:hypothetical protein
VVVQAVRVVARVVARVVVAQTARAPRAVGQRQKKTTREERGAAGG